MRHLPRLAAALMALGLLAAEAPAHAADPQFVVRTTQKPPVDTVPVIADFNADGIDDILWYGTGSKTDRMWYGQASGTFVGASISVGGNFEPVVGDFDGDGNVDILWYTAGPGADYLWFGTGATLPTPAFTSRPISIGGTYRPLIDDYDDDGFTDILWYAPGPAGDAFWYGQASRTFASRSVSISGVYDYVAGGDFTGDGVDDIVWWKAGASSHPVWQSTGTRGTYSSARINGPAAGALPMVMNLDGDTLSDIVWYGSGTVADGITLGSDTSTIIPKSVSGVYEPLWGNFDGDNEANDDGSFGRDDVLWWNQAPNGADAFWRSTGTSPFFSSSASGNTHVDWVTHYPGLGNFDAGETLDVQFNDPFVPASNPFWYGIDVDGTHLARRQARSAPHARPFSITGAVCGAVPATGLGRACAAARS